MPTSVDLCVCVRMYLQPIHPPPKHKCNIPPHHRCTLCTYTHAHTHMHTHTHVRMSSACHLYICTHSIILYILSCSLLLYICTSVTKQSIQVQHGPAEVSGRWWDRRCSVQDMCVAAREVKDSVSGTCVCMNQTRVYT